MLDPLRRLIIPTLVSCFWIGACAPRSPRALSSSGTIEMTEVFLSAPLPGRVDTLLVHEGDPVNAGQLIGTLDHYQKTRKDFERARQLMASGESSEQQLESSQLAFRDQSLISSIDGVVLERVSEPGEVVSPGIPIVTLGDVKEMWVKVYLPESEIGRVRVGQNAQITVDSLPGQRFAGRVVFVSPKAEFTPKNVQTREERVTQMFAVKVALVAFEGRLKPGMPADVALEAGDH